MNMLVGLVTLLFSFIAVVTPLTDADRIAIDTARDDRSYEDEAIAVLLTHAATWTAEPGVGEEPIRLTPDVAAMLKEPAKYRGALCRIEGRLEQRSGLAGSYAGADEWFVRMGDGTPVIVYLPVNDGMKQLRDGERIAINARFCKRMKFTARDETEHTYAAFVGAHPWRVGATANPWQGLWIPAALVMILLVAFMVVFAIVRKGTAARKAGARPMGRLVSDETEMDAVALPSDPADALAELRRRQGARS